MALNLDNENSVFDFAVRKGYGVKGLVDLGISKVPNLYIQPSTNRIPELPTRLQNLFQPIDLSKLDGPDHAQVVEAIGRAAKTVGFLQVVNHGVPSELLESVISSARRFFNQPPDAKAVYRQSVSPSPLVKYGTSFAPEKETSLEWKDYLNLFYTSDVEALRHWPNVCKEEALDFLKSSEKMVRRIFEALIENLELRLDKTRVESLIGGKRVKMIYYPECPNPDLTIGAQKHSDATTLTVILQDGNGGLQLRLEEDSDDQARTNENWIEIPPIHGALVVHVGDALQILSNGHYKSALHRVRTNNKRSRVSVPIFVSPLVTENIGPLPQLVEREGIARYRELVFEEYLTYYFQNAHLGKKLVYFAQTDHSS